MANAFYHWPTILKFGMIVEINFINVMRKHFFIALVTLLAVSTAFAQGKGVKVGYIDMDYILEKAPEYAEAKNQLEQKAQLWKQEIEVKKTEITKLKDNLNTERVLLTKELISEREEAIAFLEKDLLDYQQKRFGPNGDLMIQKATLIKPIQDQVFNAVQDIAAAQKYDFVFDKSSDMTMLFAAQRFDLSDRVLRVLVRAQKKEQMTKKQIKEQEKEDALDDMAAENPDQIERQKKIDEKKAAREKLVEDRKLAAAEKKKAAEERRKQLLEERKNKGKKPAVPAADKTDDKAPATGNPVKTDSLATDKPVSEAEVKKAQAAEKKKLAAEERQRILDERKKALEEKRKKIIEDREKAKKEKEEAQKKKTEENKN